MEKKQGTAQRAQRGFFRSRPLLCICLGYALGVCLGSRFSYFWYGWIYVILLLPLALSLKKIRWKKTAFCVALAAFLVLGFQMTAVRLAAPANLPETGRWKIRGTICGEVESSENGVWFDAKNVQVQIGETWQKIPGQVYCFVSGGREGKLQHGQRIELTGDTSLPQPARNPGAFDQKMWMARRGAKVALYGESMPKVLKEAGFSLRGEAFEIRDALSERADMLFGNASSVVRAMVLGDTDDIPESWNGWMESGGLSHLLAVSGLHVCFWYALLQLLIRPLRLSPKVRWWCLAILLSAYALITGLKVSVLRAALMLLISQAAMPAGRKNDPITAMSAAALVILLFRPLDLFAPGFQMSFGAVLGLLLLGNTLSRVSKNRIWQMLTATTCAQLGALPAVSHCYGTLSIMSLLTNLAAVPLAGILIPTAAAAMLVSCIWMPLAKILAIPVQLMVVCMLLLGRLAEKIPGSLLNVAPFAHWTTAALYTIMYLFSSGLSWKIVRRLLAAVLAAVLALGAGIVFYKSPERYIQLDVGQALSGVLETKEHCFVYDCARENGALAEYLLWRGKDVDALFLSHPHSDHIGGLLEVLDKGIDIECVYVPVNAQAYEEYPLYEECLKALAERNIAVVELKKGDVIEWGETVFEVLGPESDPGEKTDTNHRSLVLRTTINSSVLLLCGDSDGMYEPAVDCDVLQVAHHGSADAGDWRVLSKMTPQAALISCGENSYGHPNQATVRRLEESGAEVYTTRQSGAITVYFQKDGLLIEEYLQ